MECIIQYLDDLDDLAGAAALLLERLRRAFTILTVTILAITLLFATLALAIAKPPLALAVVSLLAVAMLYRAAVSHSSGARTRILPQTASHP